MYRNFVIEFTGQTDFGDEIVPPSVTMSVEISADPYQSRKWFTEELILELGTDEKQGLEIARKWIDSYWVD